MFTNISHKYKSKNFDNRKKKISFIILHYTETKTLKKAITLLTSNARKVSCHFVIDQKGKIYNLVDVKYRAWHAGESKWKKSTDINSRSIGIEIVNAGESSNEDYPNQQIKSLVHLLKELKEKFKICDEKVLGHSDIAPLRKIDPGAHFPWKKIHQNSIGIWVDDRMVKSKLSSIDYYTFLKNLKMIGYPFIKLNSKNNKNSLVVNSFHRHHLPKLLNKPPNKSSLLKTIDILDLKKH